MVADAYHNYFSVAKFCSKSCWQTDPSPFLQTTGIFTAKHLILLYVIIK